MLRQLRREHLPTDIYFGPRGRAGNASSLILDTLGPLALRQLWPLCAALLALSSRDASSHGYRGIDMVLRHGLCPSGMPPPRLPCGCVIARRLPAADWSPPLPPRPVSSQRMAGAAGPAELLHVLRLWRWFSWGGRPRWRGVLSLLMDRVIQATGLPLRRASGTARLAPRGYQRRYCPGGRRQGHDGLAC